MPGGAMRVALPVAIGGGTGGREEGGIPGCCCIGIADRGGMTCIPGGGGTPRAGIPTGAHSIGMLRTNGS